MSLQGLDGLPAHDNSQARGAGRGEASPEPVSVVKGTFAKAD